MEFILGSTSPRRKELLHNAGYKFTVISPKVDEEALFLDKPASFRVRALAELKALDALRLADKSSQTFVILTCDTLVTNSKKQILSKPFGGPKEVIKMLGSLSGKDHFVHSGFCAIQVKKNKIRIRRTGVIRTKVTFKNLTPSLIRAYSLTEEPHDKAGAYAAQGIGMSFIKSISGSYSNVIGLPMAEVTTTLSSLGVFPSWN